MFDPTRRRVLVAYDADSPAMTMIVYLLPISDAEAEEIRAEGYVTVETELHVSPTA